MIVLFGLLRRACSWGQLLLLVLLLMMLVVMVGSGARGRWLTVAGVLVIHGAAVTLRRSFHKSRLVSDDKILRASHLRHKVLIALFRVFSLDPCNLQEVLPEGQDLSLIARFDEDAGLGLD